MTKFKVGDKVMLRKDSRFYGDTRQLPPNTIGTITTIQRHTHCPIGVDWTLDNNGYNTEDLNLAELPYNRLVEKLYPNGEKIGEKWRLL